jgi:carbonic anhydrase
MKKIILVFFCLSCLAAASALAQQKPDSMPAGMNASAFVWRVIASDKGRSIEVDTASIQRAADGNVRATSRLRLDKEIVDARTGGSYKYVQTLMLHDCDRRSAATLKRSFLTASEEVLRGDEMKQAVFMPVRSGTLEEKVLRELCRPPGGHGQAQKLSERAEVAAAALRQSNEAMIRKQLEGVRRALDKPTTAGKQATIHNPASGAVSKGAAPAAPQQPQQSPLTWAYSGPGGPEHWAEVTPRNLLCREGRRQAPIDIRDTIEVDLEPLVFDYPSSRFAVTDTGRGIEVELTGNRVGLMGKFYELERVAFQHPAEEFIDGQGFMMGAHLEHRAFDGERLIVAVLLAAGAENPFIQTILNYLPLQQNRSVMPETPLDLNLLLPKERGYHTFMGSLTRPPCDEGVIWAVLQTPVAMSAGQAAVFARLYPNNARPPQPARGRLIKSSRRRAPTW